MKKGGFLEERRMNLRMKKEVGIQSSLGLKT